MKAQFLKIAKCKTDKEFYAKFPTEEAFFKAHPEAKQHVPKAQGGVDVNGNGIPDYLEGIQPMQGPQNRITLPKASIAQEEMYNPAIQSGLKTYTPSIQDTISQGQAITNAPAQEVAPLNKASFADKAMPYVGAAQSIMSGIGNLGAQQKEKMGMRQMRKVTDLQRIASGIREQEPERKYDKPWNNPVQPGQLFPTYGVGTNVLTAEDGAEIQNTYAPGTIYDDGGYEPLNDSNQVKQYAYGGYIPQAQVGGGFSSMLNNSGFGQFMGSQGGGQALGMLSGALGNNSAESQIGEGLFTAAGTAAGGPLVGTLAGTLGKGIGGMFNTSQKSIQRDKDAIRKNVNTIMGNQFGQSFQNQYSSVVRNGDDIPSYEEGGYMNPEYNPQVIAMFGDHSAQDVYDYAHEGMDSLRSGGHIKDDPYTPVSNRGLQTYAMGGELQTHWGGDAETMSYNPYLPGQGETVMFRGQSHDESDGKGNTGIGITFGNSPVEVERGEPAVKLKDGSSGEENLTVYGNLQIPNEYVSLLGDDKAKGKKFKNYIAEISKGEAKQNKIVEKSTSELNDLDVKSPFDKLKFDALTANINGANMKLKSIADKKINAAHLQNAINDTAEEHGLVADDLAKGKAKFNKEALQEYAEYGKSIPSAQKGKTFGQAIEEGRKNNSSKEIKPIRTLKFDNGTTRHIYSNGRAMDVDKNGKKEMFTPKGNDVIKANKDKKGNVTTVDATGNVKTKFTNGRVVVEEKNKKRYMGTINGDNTSWDEGNLYDPETGGLTTPTVLDASKNNRATVTTPETDTNTNTNNSTPAPNRNEPAKSKAVTTETPKTDEYVSKYGLVPWQGNVTGLKEKTKSSFTAKEWDDIADNLGFKGKGNKEFEEFLLNNPEAKKIIEARHQNLYKKSAYIDPEHLGAGWAAGDLKGLKATPATPSADTKKTTDAKKEEDKTYATTPYKRSTVMDIANQLLPYVRPTDQEGLDPQQLMGEMYALSSNQLEPVQAQGYRPDLGTPYDISLQDQLNANQADFNATQRMVGYNPAALAQLNAQKYAANTGVLGEQFRANQAMKAGVYDKNRDILNQAKMQNLQIYDQQYGRQAQAKSNTKAITQAALNSIADKYAKNKLENRELGIYENLYNYRYDPSGRAINMNPLYQPTMPTVYNEQSDANMVPVYDASGKQTGYKPALATQSTIADNSVATTDDNTTTSKSKFGKAITKHAKNGSIVKSYKNL